jgi:NADH:ubiquinone oxidoreductase subunit E/organic radical activating enzyme
MLDIDKFPKIEKVGVIMPTLRCNISCAHCLLSCSPHSGDTANIRQLKRWVTEFIDFGFNPICLTGGEVFLFPDLVKEVSVICEKHSVPLVIQTNGYWARTYEKGRETLANIPYISQLGFSFDRAHMQFISQETIKNGIRAAYEKGISSVSLSISFQNSAEVHEISTSFQKQFPKLKIESWPITPIGRALDNSTLNLSCDMYSWDDLPRSCEAQTTFTPIIYPNGDVHLCYHLTMCLGLKDPFLLGNLHKDCFRNLIKEHRNPIFEFILAYGGGSLGYLLNEIAPELIHKEYQRTCQLCYEICSNKEIVNYLTNILTLPYFSERVEKTLAFRHMDKETSPVEKNKKITLCRGKNCFGKNSYAHLRHYLTNRLVDSGKWEVASVECVDCMKACKYGPNLKLSDANEIIHHTNKSKIESIIYSL